MLAGLGLVALLGLPPPAPERESDPEDGPADFVVAPPRLEGGTAVGEPAEAGGPGQEAFRVRGRVVGTDGAPLDGVTVTLHRAVEGGRYFDVGTRASAARMVMGPSETGGGEVAPPPRWVERRAALTQADGAWAFEGVGAGFVEVLARRRDAFPASEKRALLPGEGAAEVVVDLVLAEKPSVVLRLRTPEGAPLGGGRHDLFVRRSYDDGEAAPFGWSLTRDDGRDRAAALEIVRSRGGGPSWVTVRVTAEATDDGEVEWRLPQYGFYRLAVFVPGRESFVMDGVAVPGDLRRDLGDVRLAPAAEAGRVRLVDAAGLALARRAISLSTADEFQTPVPGLGEDGARRTDADGWLSLAHVVPGATYHVWLDDPEAGRSLPLRVTARLDPGGTVRFARP